MTKTNTTSVRPYRVEKSSGPMGVMWSVIGPDGSKKSSHGGGVRGEAKKRAEQACREANTAAALQAFNDATKAKAAAKGGAA